MAYIYDIEKKPPCSEICHSARTLELIISVAMKDVDKCSGHRRLAIPLRNTSMLYIRPESANEG